MILALHIAGGIVTFISVGAVFAGVWRQWNLNWAKAALPLLAGWQTLSGLMLVFVGGNLMRVCLSGLVYLSLTGLAYVRVKKLQTA